MATITNTRAKAGFPVAGHGFTGVKKTAYGYQHLTANPAAGTVIELCRVPKGAVILGGEFFGKKLESTTSGATLDVDIGYPANGSDTADTDAFGNFGVLITAAVSGYKPEATNFRYPLANVLGVTGPKTLAAETVIQATVVASAKSFVSGGLGVVVDYILP